MSAIRSIGLAVVLALGASSSAIACTGISLDAANGASIVARTVEWALSDADHDTLVVFPRQHAFLAQTPEGLTGLSWKGKFGFLWLGA